MVDVAAGFDEAWSGGEILDATTTVSEAPGVATRSVLDGMAREIPFAERVEGVELRVTG